MENFNVLGYKTMCGINNRPVYNVQNTPCPLPESLLVNEECYDCDLNPKFGICVTTNILTA
jgi:hypothetical protein